MIEVVALLGIPVALVALLAYLERPSRGPRYSGSVYDPQLRVRVGTQADKSGMRAVHAVQAAIRVGKPGRICVACGATTFGYSPRCGRCGFENTSLTHPSPRAAELPSLIAVAATPRPTQVHPIPTEAAEPEVTGQGAPARRSLS